MYKGKPVPFWDHSIENCMLVTLQSSTKVEIRLAKTVYLAGPSGGGKRCGCEARWQPDVDEGEALRPPSSCPWVGRRDGRGGEVEPDTASRDGHQVEMS